jgi:hypothetical protein
MTRTGYHPPGDKARHLTALVRIFRRGSSDPIVRAVQSNDRRSDCRALREPLLHLLETRFTRRITDAMAIGMHNDVNKIGVVE